jgi:hypothetical protein
VYLYAITPLDYLAMRYNVARIMDGDPAPSVQITEHPISAEGLLALLPLLDCPNQYVRKGVAALLPDRRDQLEEQHDAVPNWTTYQAAETLFLHRLALVPSSKFPFEDKELRHGVWRRFKTYAYQWY